MKQFRMIEKEIQNACVFVGAGYSYVAGLPLARDLFSSEILYVSKGAEQRLDFVYKSWVEWSNENPGKSSEEFIGSIFDNREKSLVPWGWVVEYVANTLATPRGSDFPNTIYNPRYAGNIRKGSIIGSHIDFWQSILERFRVNAIITTNYDLLIERCVHTNNKRRRFQPGFWYGGFSTPQVLLGSAKFSVQNKYLYLESGIPIFKLHGSLNWAIEGVEIQMYQDMRPAFRKGGEAAIVPPVPEKKPPDWLRSTWTKAKEHLDCSDYWIICGYSMPEYDQAIRELFRQGGGSSNPKKIIILDPNSIALASMWQELLPSSKIIPLPGLPEGALLL